MTTPPPIPADAIKQAAMSWFEDSAMADTIGWDGVTMSARFVYLARMEAALTAAGLPALMERVAKLERCLSHAIACDCPSEIDFRCEGCRECEAVLASRDFIPKDTP
jgi:hypothetical protein